MNDLIFKGNWNQIKGEVRQKWGKLTNDDIERINGSRTELIGRVQERYGKAMKEAESQVADWLEELSERLNLEEGQPS